MPPVAFADTVPSHNHLCHSLSTERLASDETLSLHTGKSVEDGGNQKHNGGRNQAARTGDSADELNNAHDQVDESTHVVCLEATNEAIELA